MSAKHWLWADMTREGAVLASINKVIRSITACPALLGRWGNHKRGLLLAEQRIA